MKGLLRSIVLFVFMASFLAFPYLRFPFLWFQKRVWHGPGSRRNPGRLDFGHHRFCTNNWLQRRWDQKKWLVDKKEEAYSECLRLLYCVLRKPEVVKDKEGVDQYCLEKGSYDGLMSPIPHIPTWMTKFKFTRPKNPRRRYDRFAKRSMI